MTETTKQAGRYERIAQHGRNLLAIFPNATERDPVKLCKKLRRHEHAAAAIALQLCNGPEFDGGYDEVDRLCDAVLFKVNRLLGNRPSEAKEDYVPIRLNRDPRGSALKIPSEWLDLQRSNHKTAYKAIIERDWGGYGIIAPEID